jgi:L-asparagine transporter-like permease
VLLGIFWFGSTLYADVILVPTLMGLPLEKQQEVSGRLARRSTQVLLPVAALVVALGFLRGTVFGQLHSLADVFETTYGFTWLVALLAGLALFGWAFIVLKQALERLNTAQGPEQFAAGLTRAKVLTLAELAFFAVIFTCMILMRFGL